jgi:hypothetical protein
LPAGRQIYKVRSRKKKNKPEVNEINSISVSAPFPPFCLYRRLFSCSINQPLNPLKGTYWATVPS